MIEAPNCLVFAPTVNCVLNAFSEATPPLILSPSAVSVPLDACNTIPLLRTSPSAVTVN